MKVLLVDDDETTLAKLEHMLELWGYDFVSYNDGLSAWRALLDDEDIQLAIVDWVLPGMQGDEICRRLSKISDVRFIYTILLTVKKEMQDRLHGFNAGAHAFLTKPYSSDELRCELEVGERILRYGRRAAAPNNLQARYVDQLLSQAEEEKKQIQLMLESLPVGVMLIDNEQNRIIRANRYVSSLLGISPEYVEQKMFADIIKLSNYKGLDPGHNNVDVCTERNELVTIGSERIPILRSYIHCDLNGFSCRIETFSDLRDYTKLEREKKILLDRLQESQKCETIGRLASGIVREINTPIRFVEDNTCFLEESFREIRQIMHLHECLLHSAELNQFATEYVLEINNHRREADIDYLYEEIPKAIRQTVEGLSSIQSILTAIKDFSEIPSSKREPVNVNQHIRMVTTLVRSEWKPVADIELDLEPLLPMVVCYPDLLDQMMVCLLINAANAISETKRLPADIKGCIKIVTIHDGNWVEIRVSDDGEGMPENVQRAVFQSYNETKGMDYINHQGLSFVYKVVVDRHNGLISVESQHGQGTTFVIRLPLLPSD